MDAEIASVRTWRTKLTARLLVTVALLIVVLDAKGQDSATAATVLPLNRPFDSSVGKLPPNFVGHSYDSLVATLWKSVSRIQTKSDFETEAQYEARVTQAIASIAAKATKSASNRPMKWALVQAGPLKYDAERGSFVQRVATSSGPYISFHDEPDKFNPPTAIGPHVQLQIDFRKANLGKRYAKSARGGTVFITRNDVTTKNIYFRPCQLIDGRRADPPDARDRGIYDTEFEITLPMSAQAAQTVHKSLRLLIVADELVSPLALYEDYFSSIAPRIGSYDEGISKHSRLIVRVESIWIFDSRTGEVLTKIPSCSLPPSGSKATGDAKLYLF